MQVRELMIFSFSKREGRRKERKREELRSAAMFPEDPIAGKGRRGGKKKKEKRTSALSNKTTRH